MPNEKVEELIYEQHPRVKRNQIRLHEVYKKKSKEKQTVWRSPRTNY